MMNAMPQPAERPRDRVNILLVDDKPQNLFALETVLKPLNQNLVRAGSGEEAMKRLLKDDFALILLDVQMPGIDGFGTATYIRQIEKTKHIPIIFLTAISKDAQNVFQGYSVGAVDYLVKPYDPNVLRSKVSVFVDLHLKKAALAESEERFRTTFDNAPIGVGLLGTGGEWLKVNRALREMLGYSEAQFLSMTLEDVLHSADPGVDLDQIAGSAEAELGPFHLEKQFVHKSGATMYGLISLALVNSSSDGMHYFILQVNDITERKRLEVFRDRFIGHAAHELRTPVTVLKGASDLLGDTSGLSAEEIEHCLAVVTRQSKRLAWLVETLLDLSQLQEGRFLVQPESIELRELVGHVVDSTPPPEGKSVEISSDDDTIAFADRRGLNQIVTNLLTNAYKHGGSTVSIGWEQKNGVVKLVVSDNGPGVPDDLLARVFEPFVRGKQSAAVQGSGLGLALVRSLAEAVGGQIDYMPNIPGGASFVISLQVPDGE
jgi:PAS domain S-box-containing protein